MFEDCQINILVSSNDATDLQSAWGHDCCQLPKSRSGEVRVVAEMETEALQLARCVVKLDYYYYVLKEKKNSFKNADCGGENKDLDSAKM